jgi:mannose-6-phosphate isomerase-like protein (cupin superfamily)
VALIAICTTLSFVALARQEKLLMGSTVFDWNTIEAKPTKVGSVRNFFRAPTATLDELECHVTTLNAGEASHAPHQHPDEEIVIVREGTLEVFFNGQTQKAGPGSVIFLASNQMHGVRNIGTSAASYHVIRWNSPGMLKAKSK